MLTVTAESAEPSPLQQHFAATYFSLRMGLGVIAVALTLLLAMEPPPHHADRSQRASGRMGAMWKGEVLCTYIAAEAAAPMVKTSSVRAIAGVGLEGDRYAKGIGFFSHNKGVHRQVTLFESEVLDTIRRDFDKDLAPRACRMNLITRGVPLSHLVGKTFRVGEAVLRGIKLNEPCGHLEEVVGKPVAAALVHRCGLFAEVREGGVIRPGDAVEQEPQGGDSLTVSVAGDEHVC